MNIYLNLIFLDNRNTKIPVQDDSKIITKTIFGIHDTIEDFLIIGQNQLVTIGGKSLRMCRIPEESGKVRREGERRRGLNGMDKFVFI